MALRIAIPHEEQGIKEFQDKEFLTRKNRQGKQGIDQYKNNF